MGTMLSCPWGTGKPFPYVIRVRDYGIMMPMSWYYDHDVDVMGIWDLGTMTLKNLGLKGLRG